MQQQRPFLVHGIMEASIVLAQIDEHFDIVLSTPTTKLEENYNKTYSERLESDIAALKEGVKNSGDIKIFLGKKHISVISDIKKKQKSREEKGESDPELNAIVDFNQMFLSFFETKVNVGQ